MRLSKLAKTLVVLSIPTGMLAAHVLAWREEALVDGLASVLIPLKEDTEYAPGYTATGYNSVPLSSPASEVMRILGPPLERQQMTTRPGRERWVYSRSPSSTNFRIRVIFIENETVVDKANGIYFD